MSHQSQLTHSVHSVNTAAHFDGQHRRADRPLITFFVAAYLFPWTVWVSQIANGHGWISWHLPGGIALWTLFPVTVTAVAMNNGTQGLRDHWRRLTRWRVPLRWYAAATLIPISVAVLAHGGGRGRNRRRAPRRDHGAACRGRLPRVWPWPVPPHRGERLARLRPTAADDPRVAADRQHRPRGDLGLAGTCRHSSSAPRTIPRFPTPASQS